MNSIAKKTLRTVLFGFLLHSAGSYAMSDFDNEVILSPFSSAVEDEGVVHSPLYLAVKGGNLEEVKRIIEKGGVDLDKKDGGDYLMLFTARQGHDEIVKYFIEKGANIHVVDDRYKWNLVCWAAGTGLFDVVKYLCNEGMPSVSCLDVAIYASSVSTTKYLLEIGASAVEAPIFYIPGSDFAKYMMFVGDVGKYFVSPDKNFSFIEQYLNLKDKELSKKNLINIIGIMGRFTRYYDFTKTSKFPAGLILWMKNHDCLKFKDKLDLKWSMLNFAYLPKDEDEHIKYMLVAGCLHFLKPTMSSNFNKEISCFIKHMNEWEDKKFSKEKQLIHKKEPRLSWKKMRREKNKVLQQVVLFGMCAKAKHFSDIKIKHAT